MKDRIKMIMESQNMTQQSFAQFIGMSPASLSSIFSGRTRPTLNIVEAIKGRIPNVSTDWLMFGSGSMYSDAKQADEAAIHPAEGDENEALLDFALMPEHPDFSAKEENSTIFNAKKSDTREKEVVKIIEKEPRKITEIRIFFDDKTWETFVPKD